MPFLDVATFDSAVMTQVVELVSTSLGILTSFPCNMFLYGGIAAVGLTLFSRAKSAAM